MLDGISMRCYTQRLIRSIILKKKIVSKRVMKSFDFIKIVVGYVKKKSIWKITKKSSF